MDPIVTIIIPIYNVENYLKQCLESVVAQDFNCFEVIGIDDSSTDNSIDIFSSYLDDKRFKLYRHTENLGLPSARNTGLLCARGKYVFFLDSDDWIAPHALSLLYEMVASEKIQMAIGGTIKYHEETGKASVPYNHGRVMSMPFNNKSIFEKDELFFSVTSWNKLVDINFIKNNGLYFKSSPRRFEDMLTYKWYLSGAKVSTTSEITYFYRQRAQSGQPSIMQTKSIDVIADKFLAYADILRFTVNAGFFETEYDPLNSVNAMMNLPRTLSEMVDYLFSEQNNLAQNENGVEISLKASLAIRELFSLFPETYVEKLPDKVKRFYELAMSRSPIDLAADAILYGPM